MEKILIVDDTKAVLEALSLLLEIHGYDVVTTSSPEHAIELADQLRVSLVIQDMNFTADTTSGDEGRALFHEFRAINPHLPIILITAWTDLEQAIELVKAGAADYIGKPWDDQKLLTSVANLIELGKSKQQNERLTRTLQTHKPHRDAAEKIGLIYASAAMQRVVDMAMQVAKSDISALITGANGAGKEKIAELIHANSPIKEKPFVRVNCAALPADLIEAELFGAEAGAYTGANKTRIGRFEAANGGTLFLDEIGTLSYAGQTKLLRVLQTGEFERLGSVDTMQVKVRVISATNANLPELIASGEFREDLYYRLNVIELHLPALSKRLDDIQPLLTHFLPERAFSLDAEKAMMQHTWQGNVRELENLCKRLAVMKPEGIIEREDLAFVDMQGNSTQTGVIKEPTKDELQRAMKQHEGVIARVARHFGLSRQALYRRLTKFGIEY
ncbi:sigma-54-dependent transcriptional regulator [Glaciecola sp. SC05]|uniref:sigma-54-dependent transcriptional regulator n=1 Tax=Glaciecola sp. SC05 TaxID=1987355 RepID=UPI00352792C7